MRGKIILSAVLAAAGLAAGTAAPALAHRPSSLSRFPATDSQPADGCFDAHLRAVPRRGVRARTSRTRPR